MLIKSVRRGAIACALVLSAFAPSLAAAEEVSGLLRPSLDRWSGLYVGAYLGAHDIDTSGVFDGAELGVTPDLRNLGDEGLHGGIAAGASFQWWRLVFGVEADMSFGGFEKSYLTIQDGSATEDGLFVYPIVGDLSHIATVRGRVGFDLGPIFSHDVLIFASGGYAFTRFEMNVAGRSTLQFDADAVVFGGGFEIALSPKWSVGAEYLHHAFDERLLIAEDIVSGVFDANAGNVVRLHDVDTIRTTVRYSIGG